MSDTPTPRTDRAGADGMYSTMVNHALRLERELAEVTKQRDALAEAIQWALGVGEDGFRDRCINEGQYWWRKELRERAALAATKGANETATYKDNLIVDLVNFLTDAIAGCETQAENFKNIGLSRARNGSLAMRTAYLITLNHINAQTTKGGSRE